MTSRPRIYRALNNLGVYRWYSKCDLCDTMIVGGYYELKHAYNATLAHAKSWKHFEAAAEKLNPNRDPLSYLNPLTM